MRVCLISPWKNFLLVTLLGPMGLSFLISSALRCFAAKSLGSRKQFGLGRRLFFCRWNGAGMTPFVNSFQVPKVQVRVGCRSRNISVPEQLLNDPQVTPFSSSGRELPQD